MQVLRSFEAIEVDKILNVAQAALKAYIVKLKAEDPYYKNNKESPTRKYLDTKTISLGRCKTIPLLLAGEKKQEDEQKNKNKKYPAAMLILNLLSVTLTKKERTWAHANTAR